MRTAGERSMSPVYRFLQQSPNCPFLPFQLGLKYGVISIDDDFETSAFFSNAGNTETEKFVIGKPGLNFVVRVSNINPQFQTLIC